MALEGGHLDMVKCLINAGCNLNLKTLWCNVTAFDQAIYDDFFRAARLIYKAGFDVKSSEHYVDIINGKMPKITINNDGTGIPGLFALSVKTVRTRLIQTQGGISSRILDQLKLPNKLTLSIFPLTTDNGQKWWRQGRVGRLLRSSEHGKHTQGAKTNQKQNNHDQNQG